VESARSAPLLVDALSGLRDRVVQPRLGLEIGGVEQARRGQRELAGQLDDYVIPRLRQIDAPLLVVVGGSTGAGKSTLVNSLVGTEVTAPGVLRPTTRTPVLVCNPADRPWYAGSHVLPGLARATGAATDARAMHLVSHAAVPPGLAILDAPDIDSVVTENRQLAGQLMAAADLWLFVTTAARYADAVPWELLRTARARSIALAVVLNRVPSGASAEVTAHLGAMLRDNGLGDAELFSIDETELEDGRLPAAQLAGVRRWLDALAADADARAAVVRTTLDGALDSLAVRVPALADHLNAQLAAASTLQAEAQAAYGRALAEIDEGVANGSLLRGEVLSRWQDFIGTGELMRALESRIGGLRDRLRAAVTGRPVAGRELKAALESSVESLVRAAADRAAERTHDSWSATGAGKALLEHGGRTLMGSTRDLPATVEDEVRAWQGHVLDLVAREGATKRTAARFLSYSVNAAGLALMVTVFAHTGGLTGGEVAVAGGTSALSQKLLEAVFGDQAVRELAAEARKDLLARVERLLDTQRRRYDALVADAAPDADSATHLRAALAAVQAQRAPTQLGAAP
jgi:energy-coupling factor transporter ATP-binding protein EcfA2